MAKKKKDNKKKKPLGATAIVLMTMLFVSNAVWAFVMHDFDKKAALRDHYILNQDKVRKISDDLITYLSYKNCIDKRDIWKVFAMQGIVRTSEILWTLAPYEFHFSGNGCLTMEHPEGDDDAHGDAHDGDHGDDHQSGGHEDKSSHAKTESADHH